MEITLKAGTSLQVNDEVALVLVADTTFDLPAIDEQHYAELIQASKLGASVVAGGAEVAPEPEAPAPKPKKAKAPVKKAPAKAVAKAPAKPKAKGKK